MSDDEKIAVEVKEPISKSAKKNRKRKQKAKADVVVNEETSVAQIEKEEISCNESIHEEKETGISLVVDETPSFPIESTDIDADEIPALQPSESIVYHGWDMYQLGKVISLGIDNIELPPEIGKTSYTSERERYYEQFSETLATSYWKVMDRFERTYVKDGEVNLQILDGLISSLDDPSLKPASETIVLHLTLGDKLNRVDSRYERQLNVAELLDYGVVIDKEVYLKPIEEYMTQIDRLRRIALSKGINPKVIIFAGTPMSREHYAKIGLEYDDLSAEILTQYKERISALGIECQVRAGGDPDWDFIYMCKAPAFIGSGGYYSELISKYRDFANIKATYASGRSQPSIRMSMMRQ